MNCESSAAFSGGLPRTGRSTGRGAARRVWLGASVGVLWAIALAGVAVAEPRFITVASTTSTQNSGLYDAILPKFTEKTGIEVRVVAVGTGQALRIGRNGDADVVVVHDKASEEAFVAEGYGVERFDLMYNDFVLVGPSADPAELSGLDDVGEALGRVARSHAPFVSRGDDSGTHKAEMRLWKLAGIDPVPYSGQWYREVGAGMGATLNTASAMNAYTLTDRGTWLSFRNRSDLTIVVEGQPPLFNQYGVILVNPERRAHVKAEDAQRFIDWLLSPDGQSAIGSFEVEGQSLFHPNATAGARPSHPGDASVSTPRGVSSDP